MTPEQIKLINLSVETCGVILCLLGIILVHVGTKIEKRTGKYFFHACLSMRLPP